MPAHGGAAGDGNDELSGVDSITFDEIGTPAAPDCSRCRWSWQPPRFSSVAVPVVVAVAVTVTIHATGQPASKRGARVRELRDGLGGVVPTEGLNFLQNVDFRKISHQLDDELAIELAGERVAGNLVLEVLEGSSGRLVTPASLLVDLRNELLQVRLELLADLSNPIVVIDFLVGNEMFYVIGE